MQEFPENNNITFVGYSSKSCKEGFDKVKATDKLSKSGFFMFPSISFTENKKENQKIIERFFDLNKLKKAVKPANGGSSIVVYCVYSYQEAIEKAELFFNQKMMPVIVEPFCLGREFTILVIQNLNNGKPVSLKHFIVFLKSLIQLIPTF